MRTQNSFNPEISLLFSWLYDGSAFILCGKTNGYVICRVVMDHVCGYTIKTGHGIERKRGKHTHLNMQIWMTKHFNLEESAFRRLILLLLLPLSVIHKQISTLLSNQNKKKTRERERLPVEETSLLNMCTLL